MIEIYLLRHSNTIWGETIISGRSSNLPLSTVGLTRALNLGEILLQQNFEIDNIFCSSSLRTRQTLDAIKSSGLWVNSPVEFSDDLQEVSQGEWEGCPREVVISKDVQVKIDKEGPKFMPPGGESQIAAGERIANYIRDAIIEKHDNTRCLVIGHANLFRCFIYKIMRFNPCMINKIGFSNLGLTKLRYDSSGQWRLDYMNHCLL